jgi:23S rRNA (uracil1939-C5)-methyltransferase
MTFRPTDFTQVNAGINRVLVHRAVRMLELAPEDRVADLFCGLGNFSLPIARTSRAVVGIEGSKSLTERAMANASAHGLGDRVRFAVANLFEVDAAFFTAQGRFDKALVDPPRDGAIAVVKAFAELGDEAPRRIVYVSCNPSTLARDAAVLTTQAGYRLREAGVVNMFPQTSHVESIALFTRD